MCGRANPVIWIRDEDVPVAMACDIVGHGRAHSLQPLGREHVLESNDAPVIKFVCEPGCRNSIEVNGIRSHCVRVNHLPVHRNLL